MRGDRPAPRKKKAAEVLFTPHARGSTHKKNLESTLVSVFTPHARGSTVPLAIPDNPKVVYPAYGDRPQKLGEIFDLEWFTPHARIDPPNLPPSTPYAFLPRIAGIDPSCLTPSERDSVYPAYAGIDLLNSMHDLN